MIAKKNRKSKSGGESETRGFLPDFSRYLFRDFPIEDAYRNHVLIDKLKALVSELITTQNPAQDLQKNGICHKLERLQQNTDKAFVNKCNFPEGPIYYAAYGNNPYRIVFGIDTNQRIAYFFALDTKHSIRKG